MTDIYALDRLIGFKKPASKLADWIVDTYLPNSPVLYRISIENSIAKAIIDAMNDDELYAHLTKSKTPRPSAPLPEARGALTASPLPKAETQPMAWMYKDKVSPRATPQLLLKRHDVYSTHPEMIEIPLYAHPSPQPEAATIDAEIPASVQALPQQWLDEANAMPGSIPEQIAGCQMRICADQLKKALNGARIDAIEAAIDICQDLNVDDNEGNIQSVAAIIRKHASEHAGKQGWVKCSERMPKEADWVLMYLGNSKYAPGSSAYQTGIVFTNRETGILEWCSDDAIQAVNDYKFPAEWVTHWKPLITVQIAAAPDSAGKQ